MRLTPRFGGCVSGIGAIWKKLASFGVFELLGAISEGDGKLKD